MLVLVWLLTTSAPARAVTIQRNVHYGEAAAQILDLYRPPQPGPTAAVVFLHSLGRTKGEWASAANFVAARGRVAVTIDYRLSAPWPTAFDDVEAAVDFLRARAPGLGIDADRIALGGDSLGATLALDVATRRGAGFVRAAFGWSGAYDLRALAVRSEGWDSAIATSLTGCTLEVCRDRYEYASAIRWVDGSDPRARIVNSAHELMPLSQLTAMDSALTAAGVYHETRIVPGVIHGHGLTTAEWPATWAFLKVQLGH